MTFIQLKKECREIGRIVEVKEDDLPQLLENAKDKNYEAFIDELGWIAAGEKSTTGKPEPMIFVFPKCLSVQERHMIHRMQGFHRYKSITLHGNLYLFAKNVK